MRPPSTARLQYRKIPVETITDPCGRDTGEDISCEERLISVLSVFGFGIPFDVAVCLLLCKILALIVQLFTAADAELYLDA